MSPDHSFGAWSYSATSTSGERHCHQGQAQCGPTKLGAALAPQHHGHQEHESNHLTSRHFPFESVGKTSASLKQLMLALGQQISTLALCTLRTSTKAHHGDATWNRCAAQLMRMGLFLYEDFMRHVHAAIPYTHPHPFSSVAWGKQCRQFLLRTRSTNRHTYLPFTAKPLC